GPGAVGTEAKGAEETKNESNAMIDSENHGNPMSTAMPRCMRMTPTSATRRVTWWSSPTAKKSWTNTATYVPTTTTTSLCVRSRLSCGNTAYSCRLSGW